MEKDVLTNRDSYRYQYHHMFQPGATLNFYLDNLCLCLDNHLQGELGVGSVEDFHNLQGELEVGLVEDFLN